MPHTREGRVTGIHLMWIFSFLLPVVALFAASSPAAGQEDTFSLEGLVVTASPTARSADHVANHVTVLDGDALRTQGVRWVSEALRTVPGIAIVQGGSFGAITSLFLRGGESDYTLVLVDGVQVNQPGGGFDFAGLTTDNVARIEVVRGPSSALYGSDAMAGVIHIITRTGRGSPTASFGFEGGSFGRQDWAADFHGGSARTAYSFSVARRSIDGILAFNNAHRSTTLSGVVSVLPDDRTRVDVSLRIQDREFQFPTDGSGAVVDRNAFNFDDGTSARIAVRRQLAGWLSLVGSVGLNETGTGTDDAPDGPSDNVGFFGFSSFNDFRRAAGEVRADIELDHATLSAGAELEQERQRSFTESLSEFGDSQGRSESARENRAYFVYATGERDRLAFNAGARLEDNQRFGRSVSWQAGGTWVALAEVGTLLRGAVGSAIKEPTFFENFATGFAVGNPDLDPERALSWELGAAQPLLEERLEVNATYFDQKFEDLIQYTFAPPNPGDPNFFNVAEAASRGLEVGVVGHVGQSRLTASWTWLETEVIDSGFDDGPAATFVEGEALLRRPSHVLAVQGATSVGPVDLSADLRHIGSRSDRDFSTFPATPVTLESYRLLAVGAEWEAVPSRGGRPGLAITVRGENLLDAGYEEVWGFGAPGRGLYLGARVGFGG